MDSEYPCPVCDRATAWAPPPVAWRTRVCLTPLGCGYSWQPNGFLFLEATPGFEPGYRALQAPA
jgi:hypothetical protein